MKELKDFVKVPVAPDLPNKLKFRAECAIDVERFFDLVEPSKFAIYNVVHDKEGLPDKEVIFYTSLSLNETRDIMRKVVDGHVMLQTVALEEEYSGERDYNLNKTH